MASLTNKRFTCLAFALCACLAGCQGGEPPEDPRLAELRGATATGGQLVSGGQQVELTSQQAAEALKIIVHCHQVQPDRMSTTFPGTGGPGPDVRMQVELELADGTTDTASVGYYTSEEVVALDGGNFNKRPPDDEKIMGFVRGVFSSSGD